MKIPSYSKIPLLVKVVIAIILGVLVGLAAPGWLVRTMNTFNGIFDQLLKFIIPLIIIGMVVPAISDIGRQAGRMLVATAALAYGFTVLSGSFAYLFSAAWFPKILTGTAMTALEDTGVSFPAFFSIQIPPLMEVMTSLVLSFMVGLGIAAFDAKAIRKAFREFRVIVESTISSVILPLLPIYIFGLFLDMAAVGKVGTVLLAFMKVIVIIFSMTLVLLVLQYCIAGLIAGRNPFRSLSRMLPAYFTALGTSSSAATIPVTLRQTVANGVDERIAGFVVPLCATIHLSGSTLKITSCAIALMIMTGHSFDFPMMLGFIMMLGVTMVAAPGVPGGAIMAALGVLESMLGFDPAEQAMMITLYIAMDSFGTACNVTGDGAIALIMNRLSNTQK